MVADLILGIVLMVASIGYLVYAKFLKSKFFEEDAVMLRLKRLASFVVAALGLELILQYMGLLAP